MRSRKQNITALSMIERRATAEFFNDQVDVDSSDDDGARSMQSGSSRATASARAVMRLLREQQRPTNKPQLTSAAVTSLAREAAQGASSAEGAPRAVSSAWAGHSSQPESRSQLASTIGEYERYSRPSSSLDVVHRRDVKGNSDVSCRPSSAASGGAATVLRPSSAIGERAATATASAARVSVHVAPLLCPTPQQTPRCATPQLGAKDRCATPQSRPPAHQRTPRGKEAFHDRAAAQDRTTEPRAPLSARPSHGRRPGPTTSKCGGGGAPQSARGLGPSRPPSRSR